MYAKGVCWTTIGPYPNFISLRLGVGTFEYDEADPDIPKKLLIHYENSQVSHLFDLEDLLLIPFFARIFAKKYKNMSDFGIEIKNMSDFGIGTCSLSNKYPLEGATANHLKILVDFAVQLKKDANEVSLNTSVGSFKLPQDANELSILAQIDSLYNGKKIIQTRHFLQ